MDNVFLDSSILQNQQVEETIKLDVQQHRIRFEFPQGFTQLRLIEECRALNALDVSDPDNFDLMFDIMMQMLTGKVVFIYFLDDSGSKHEIGKFVVVDRYMNLRSCELIDEYPIIVNWMVEFIAGYLGKKFPRSLKSVQVRMSEREELLKKSLQEEKKVQIKMSQTQ